MGYWRREPETEATHVDIRRAALNLLARREHSRQELRHKLQQRFAVEITLIENEIALLSEQGLQSDARLAEVFLRSRAGRGQGPLKIRAELKNKGVDNTTIEKVFTDFDMDWIAGIKTVVQKQFGNTPPANAKERARRIRFLQQRGFSFDQINSLY